MKKILPILCCIYFSGCSKVLKQGAAPASYPDLSNEVILIDAERFPLEASGVWLNEEYGWILRIEEDGRLSKIRHTIGRAAIKSGETSSFPLINDGFAVIEPGPWYVQYDGKDKIVTIEINIKNFLYDLGGGNVVKGSSRDVFVGSAPSKGREIWVLNWLSFPEYIASTGDKQYLDYHLPSEPGDEDKGEIVFKRLKSSEGN